MALCNLEMVLESNGLAETTVASTTPLYAEFKTENCLATAGKSSNLWLSDKTSNKFWTIGSSFKAPLTVEMTCFLELKDNEGLVKIEPNLGSSLMAVLNFSTEA